MVINTHYHFDHLSGNHLFPRARVYMNPVEVGVFSNLGLVGEWIGIREVFGEEGVAGWLKTVARPDSPQTEFSPSSRHEWWLSTRAPAGSYVYDRVWEIGKTRVVMVHAPGHTNGFCCPYFPDEGLVYTGDIDLTGFGPWYCGSDGNIEQFLLSAQRVARLDAEWFVTGHQAGTVSRADFAGKLEQFLEVVNQRQERLMGFLEAGIQPEDIPSHGLLYPPKYQVDPWVVMWERIGVRKHMAFLRKGKGDGN
jgi:glyoxylase-like metal-dependent hydrolase (beta-lactamase superfamily II)